MGKVPGDNTGRRRDARSSTRLMLIAAVAAGLLCLSLGNAATILAASKQKASASGSVTFALAPDTTSTYIFPLQGFQGAGVVDDNQFQMVIYRPLYWFGKSNGTPQYDAQRSLANAPVYSNGGKTITMTLKHYEWSDGTPVTSRDVEFWMNEIEQEKDNYIGYVPGQFPANVVSASYPNSSTVVLTFNKAYNHLWMLDNELPNIFPLPQQSWDKTSQAGTIGNYDETPSGAVAVYNFLNTQSKTLATYATNPLWQVVDGPYRLKAYNSSSGYTVLTANPNYSGTPKPTVKNIIEQPFTSFPAEFDALRSGLLQYGYLPPTDISQTSYFEKHGYKVVGWSTWGIAYAAYNFTNPTVGPMLKQLYFRQALQHLVDQPEYITQFWAGAATPDYGPVPLSAGKGSYLTKYETHNPYPYSVNKAKKLLASHGWTKNASGTLECTSAGSGPTDCGTGVVAGAIANLSLVYASGNEALQNQFDALQSSLSRIGVNLTLRAAPYNDVDSVAPCTAGQSGGCDWEMASWAGWTWDPDYLPEAGEIFATGAIGNVGGYSSAKADALVEASDTAAGNTLAPMEAEENYFASELPVMYLPNFDIQVSVIKDDLRGAVPQNTVGTINPENWRLSK